MGIAFCFSSIFPLIYPKIFFVKSVQIGYVVVFGLRHWEEKGKRMYLWLGSLLPAMSPCQVMAGMTPSQVTGLGFIVVAGCVSYLEHCIVRFNKQIFLT